MLENGSSIRSDELSEGPSEISILRERIAGLETLLERLSTSEEQLANAERIGKSGSFEWHVAKDAVSWTAGLYRLYGIEPSTFDGTADSYLSHVHPADRERVGQTIRGALDNLLPYEMDYRIVRPDGTIRLLRARAEVVVDPSGRPVKLRGTCQDVTERVQAEESARRLASKAAELQQAHTLARVKDHLLSSLSHEMKTLLSLIQGYAELLQDRFPGDEALAGIQDGVRRLAGLVSDIVDLAALLGRTLTLYKSEVCIPEAIEMALAATEPARKETGIAIEKAIEPELPCIEADSRRVVQMLEELLANAARFSAHGSRIRVGAGRERQFVRLTIQDQGEGMEQSALSRIFEAFHQEDVGLAMRKGGLGIGLTIVKLLAELHGGRVEVESQPGAGSRFSILLPAAGA